MSNKTKTEKEIKTRCIYKNKNDIKNTKND